MNLGCVGRSVFLLESRLFLLRPSTFQSPSAACHQDLCPIRICESQHHSWPSHGDHCSQVDLMHSSLSPSAPYLLWQGLPVFLLQYPQGWGAPPLELHFSREWTHRAQRASKHRESSRYRRFLHFPAGTGSLGNTSNLFPPPPSSASFPGPPAHDTSLTPSPCSLV